MTETDSRLEELVAQKSILFDDEGPQCFCAENTHSARAYQRHAPASASRAIVPSVPKKMHQPR